MSNHNNTAWIEEARVNLEEACKLGDWPMARAVIADLEENGFDATYARRFLNLAMAESDDITLEPYEHPTPPIIKPSETDEPRSNSFESEYATERGEEGLETFKV